MEPDLTSTDRAGLTGMPMRLARRGWHAVKRRLFDHYQRRFERGDLGVLFLAGHMRSGSSLLVHILNSNPEILGYGETHRAYATPRNVAELAYDLHRAFRRLRLPETYLMDKVLHPYLTSEAVLRSPAARFVFLVRAPAESLLSIRDIDASGVSTERDALDYYTGRLRTLIRRAATVAAPQRCFFLTYEQLLHRTPEVLDALRDTLALDHPLSERYDTIWATGRPTLGDSSEVIEAGRIVRKKKPPKRSFPAPLVREARPVYERCVETLARRCTSLPLRASRSEA